MAANLEALETLKAALMTGGIAEKDKAFAESLVTQSASRGLSDKQWYWVTKLALALSGGNIRKMGDLSSVYAMFQKAAAHLKYPKVLLTASSGVTLKLYVSGGRSRLPGVVNVVSTFTEQWLGRVHKDGSWEVASGVDAHTLADAEEVLRRFAADPERVAAEYGRLTGNCCFCSRSLTDDRSTDVGYGKICGSRYGLKWGKA